MGLSFYGGDLDASKYREKAVVRSVGGDISWQIVPAFAVGLGYQTTTLPRVVGVTGVPPVLHVMQATMRLSPTSGRFTPYLTLGAHRVEGGYAPGSGPVLGMGLSAAINRRLNLFTEWSTNFVFPDEAVDGVADGAEFDQIGFLNVGVRLTNPGVRYARPVRIRTLEAPSTMKVGAERRFRIGIDDAVTRPALVTWDLDDGSVRMGPVMNHAYARPGRYTVTVTAGNVHGWDVRVHTVTVLPDSTPRMADAGIDVAVDSLVLQVEDVARRMDRLTGAVSEAAGRVSEVVSNTGAPPAGPTPELVGQFVWVVASSRDLANAQRLSLQYDAWGYPNFVVSASSGSTNLHRIAFGPFDHRQAALAARHTLPPDAPSDIWLLRVQPDFVVRRSAGGGR